MYKQDSSFSVREDSQRGNKAGGIVNFSRPHIALLISRDHKTSNRLKIIALQFGFFFRLSYIDIDISKSHNVNISCVLVKLLICCFF